jgi:diguanylate cyclase (GGDEF)-like protein
MRIKKIGPLVVDQIDEEIEQDEIKGFARSVAEVEWLLLILVLLYLVAPGTTVGNKELVLGAIIAFAAIIMVFRYLNFFRPQTRFKIAVEAMIMVGFITVVLLPTGGTASPLLNLYLLPIVVAALTLGKWVTLLMMALISTCYVFVGADITHIMSLAGLSSILSQLAPFLLVAFITTMLANDIHIARNRIHALSETDELTGLHNMRAFSRFHKREHEKAKRYDRGYGIMLLDMDNLKQMNDSFGHEAGNRAIVLVANVIARLIRNTDIAARYGGDEFIILLSETDPERIAEIAQRIRNSVQNTTLDFDGRMLRTSVSVGIASFPDDGRDIRD